MTDQRTDTGAATEASAFAGLTRKQQVFVEEYLIDCNATKAAIRAGYAASCARQTGYELMGRADIQAAIEQAQAERSGRTLVDADRVLTELAHIGMLDPADLASIGAAAGPDDIAKLPEHVRRAVAGWSWDRGGNFVIKLHDKLRALEMIGKHLAMFTDRLQVDATEDLAKAIKAGRERAAALH